MNEFGEPWQIDSLRLIRNWNWVYIMSGETMLASMDLKAPHPDKTAERIVACVNALAGVPTERILQLEPGALANAIDQVDSRHASNLDCSYCSVNACLRKTDK